MNSIDLTPLYRNSVGFDSLASLIDAAFRADNTSDSFPPFNIEALDNDRYAISLAVAGFTANELDITVENGTLSVRGKKGKQSERKFLHQGIATRAFERQFTLAEHVRVTGAELNDGLLTVHLVKEVPEAMRPKTIPIQAGSSLLEHRDESSQPQNEQAA